MKFPEISGKFPDFRPATLLFPLRSHALVPLSTVGQGTKWRRNITENFNRLIRAHERWTDRRYRQTDGFTTIWTHLFANQAETDRKSTDIYREIHN